MSKKRKAAIAAIASCIALTGISGTLAWLSVQNSLQNQFTVGTFGEPSTKPDPDKPGSGDDDSLIEDDVNPGSLDGHLYEPNWKVSDEHHIVPGNEYAKDPFVGMTADSEDAYVYIYVKNNAPTEDALYFNLNKDWSAVTGNETVNDAYEAKAASAGAEDPKGTGDSATGNYYSSGLFKYTEGLTGDGVASQDVWTKTPLFDKLLVKADAVESDLIESTNLEEGNLENSVDVYAFMYQMKNADDETLNESDALEWVNSQIAAIR